MYRSQLRMMGGRGSGVWSQNDVAAYLLDVRDWLVAWDGATTAFVQYEALLRSPRAQAQMLERLLNRQLDIDAMVAAVHSETR